MLTVELRMRGVNSKDRQEFQMTGLGNRPEYAVEAEAVV